MEWKVIGDAEPLIVASGRKLPRVHVRCSCGVERDVLKHHIASGRSLSCGHDRDAAAAVRMRLLNRSNPFKRNAWQRAHGIGRLFGDWEVVGCQYEGETRV